MKVVWWIDHLGQGGTQNVLCQVTRALASSGYQQAVICLNNVVDEEVRKKLINSGIEVRVVGKFALCTGIGFVFYWFWLRYRRFDVSVTLLFFSDIIGLPISYAAGISRRISSVRARNANYNVLQNWAIRRALRLADKVVANSVALERYIVKDLGVAREKLSFIGNPLDLSDLTDSTSNEEFRRLFNLPPTVLIIGASGRLAHQKGFDVLIKAFSLVEDLSTHLIVFGDGKEKNHLIQMSEFLGVADRIHFVGYRRDMKRFLRHIYLYVQPSRFEGVPNAMLEAMGAGRPVIGAAVDGIEKLLEDERRGWLVSPDDPSQLAKTIDLVLYQKAEAARRGDRARDHIRDLCNETEILKLWKELFQVVKKNRESNCNDRGLD